MSVKQVLKTIQSLERSDVQEYRIRADADNELVIYVKYSIRDEQNKIYESSVRSVVMNSEDGQSLLDSLDSIRSVLNSDLEF